MKVVRGNSSGWNVRKFQFCIREESFTVRMMKHWEGLVPLELVESSVL